MLKLIPEERPENRRPKSQDLQSGWRSKKTTLKSGKNRTRSEEGARTQGEARSKNRTSPKLQQKYTLELSHSNKVLKIVGYKMVNMSKNDHPSDDDVKGLIHGLQKSIICLQKQRHKRVRDRRRKG
ncbi:MAG TPA: hypothetical protein VI588_02855 [Candidatus Gracilibacteria bacterium]|nr:hypothetical protein [Candidatus Gracilibacteria bacterium]